MWNHIEIGGVGDDISQILTIKQTNEIDDFGSFIWERKYLYYE